MSITQQQAITALWRIETWIGDAAPEARKVLRQYIEQGAGAAPGSEIKALCALTERDTIAVNLMLGGLGKHHARRVADAILGAAPGADVVARLAKAESEVARMRDLLDRRPAMNADLMQSFINWTSLVYRSDAMATAGLTCPANDAVQHPQQEQSKRRNYVDCGECPRISTGCADVCDKAKPRPLQREQPK